jgi:ribonuclease BN (tRNA processing enzyme)
MFRVLFLGTGGGRVATTLQMRATGGIVLNYNENQIHIDPGPGAVIRAKQYGINVRRTNIVCVSHCHADHSEGLMSIIEGMGNFGKYINGFLITHPLCLEAKYALLPEKYKEYLKKIILLDENQGVKIKDMTIISLRAVHGTSPCIGFKFITPELTLTYTSDTEYFEEMKDIYDNSDVIIFNVLRPGADGIPGHLCSENVVRIINEMERKPKMIILTHFGMRMIRSNPIMEARDIYRKTGVPVTAASDGQKIDINDILKQQRLYKY